MTKKKDILHQRMLAAARQALAVRHAVSPVPRFSARTAEIDKARKRARAENQPTVEQEAKADFVEVDVNDYVGDRRVKIGRAFRRHARFEKIDGLTVAQIMALRAYRKAFDESERSPVKSGLDIGAGGGGSPDWAAIGRAEALAFADHEVRRIEASVSPDVLHTLRMVALGDLDFKAVALERFGNARGRLRERVRAEFMRAVAQLAAPCSRTPQAVSAPPPPVESTLIKPIDPAYRDERGFMRPYEEIAALIRAGQVDDSCPEQR